MLLFKKKSVETAEEYYEAVKAGYQPAFLSWESVDYSEALFGYAAAKRFEDDTAACLYFARTVSEWDIEDLFLYGAKDKEVEDYNRLRSLADGGNALACAIFGSYLLGMGYNEERAGRGLAYLQQAASQGNVEAAVRLADFFLLEGKYYDLAKVEYYSRFAFDCGYYAGSIRSLVRLLLEGGRAQELLPLLEKAYEDGEADAAVKLGDLYSNARNFSVSTETANRTRSKYIPLDWDKAWKWYNLALNDYGLSDEERPYVVSRVAYALEHGYGVEKDEERAFMLYKNTAKASSLSATRLARAYEEGWFVEINLKKAVYWYQRACYTAYALYRLGYYYYHGLHVKQNTKKAKEYLGYATSEGHQGEDGYEQACALLAEINGETYTPAEPIAQPAPKATPKVETSREKTPFEALCERAENGDVGAQVELGMIYWEGSAGVKDFAKAAYWWTKAAEGDSADARAFLAACYMEGNGVEKNVSVGIRLLEKAVSQDCAAACCMLAIAYEKGDGVEVDFDRAYSLYKKSLAIGVLSEKSRERAVKALEGYEKNRCPSCDSFYCKAEKRSIFGAEYYCKKCGYKY